MKMSYSVSCFNWRRVILETSDIPYQAKYLAVYLSTFMKGTHESAHPSLSRIEYETGMSRPTVLKYLKWLVNEGWITMSKNSFHTSGGEQQHNVYTLSFPTGISVQTN